MQRHVAITCKKLGKNNNVTKGHHSLLYYEKNWKIIKNIIILKDYFPWCEYFVSKEAI